MASYQAGAPTGAEQMNASPQRLAQNEASEPREAAQQRTVKTSTPAAFGKGGGAAVVIRDYASI